MKIRLMLPEDIPAISRWMADMPLWRRYGVTEAGASAQFAGALQRGDCCWSADDAAASPGACAAARSGAATTCG